MTRIGVVLLMALGLNAAAVPANQDELRVLFIGNSLTAFNNLPRVVEQLTGQGGPRIRASAITRNDFSLDDHWDQGDAVRAINRGGWTIVVLQQGPSALPASRVQLRASTKRFDEVIRKSGARTALYMVWPSEARAHDFDAVRESYAVAAADVGGVFIPAGEAWRAAWRREPGTELYASDRFHPTAKGSLLAALVIAQVLTGRDVMPAPSGADGPLLRDAAAEAVLRHRIRGGQRRESQHLRGWKARPLISRYVAEPLM